MKKTTIGLFLIVFVTAGGSCGTTTVPGVPNPVPDTGISCNTRYWNEEHKVGFDVPAGMIGPVIDTYPVEDSALVLGWLWRDGGAVPDMSLVSLPSENALDEVVARQVQGRTDFQIFKSEPITLNSGQQGWIIAGTHVDFPDTLMSIQVILVGNGRIRLLLVYGEEQKGTYDYDYLLSIGRTLCAE